MGVITTASCTPYLIGNTPHFGEHIAWAESDRGVLCKFSIGARTNREGGPSALAASLTGRTPEYGYHLNENRQPTITMAVDASLDENSDFGALGKVIGDKLEESRAGRVPFLGGLECPRWKISNLSALRWQLMAGWRSFICLESPLRLQI